MMNNGGCGSEKRRREVTESLIVGTVISCVQNFIYDISVGACKGLIKKYKQKRFFKRVENEIQSFCKKNESLYIDSESFQNFITYHKPFDRVMENALSLGDDLSIDQLSNDIVFEAEESAQIGGQVLSVDDRRVLKDLLTLVNDEMTSYYRDVLDDGQKYIVSQNAQNTKILQRDIKKVGDGNNQRIESVEKLLRDVTAISAYKAEPITELICKKMWLGEFDEVETLCQVVSARSDDLELAIRVLKTEMLENKHESDEIKQSISHIENIKIRNIVIRNIIPLIYFRKGKFDGMGELTDSEYLKAIMAALDNEDYSYLFSMEASVEKGIEMRRYTLNKSVLNVEQWLVNQVFAIYMYNLKPVNTASLIENTIDARTSWFSALITYDKIVDLLTYEGPNNETHKELSELNELLDKKKSIYERLSDDLEAIFYALIIKISLIRAESGAAVINDIPTRLHGVRPVKDFILAGRIENRNISFEELYAFCNSVGEYWLLSAYFIALRDDGEYLVNLVNEHKELLTKSETIFFIYVEALAHLDRAEEAKANLLEYKSEYSKFFEFWNVYLNLDDSVKDDFLGLCKDNHIVYMTGHSGCILVERLICFEEYDLAEFYNNQLQVQRTNEKMSRKFKAFILNGKNKQIDALECFKLAYEDFPNDLSIVNAILSISIQLKRRIELKYIRAAEESKNPKLLVLAGGAYATNGDYSEARRCNMKALFLSDDFRNPAFNQYLGLSMHDRQDSIHVVKSVEKNTSVVLQNEDHTLVYCVHGDMELPESPCIWHGDTHLYISDAANAGIYRRRVNDVVNLNGTNYTVKSIEPLEAYISRICFESVVKNGSAKAIIAPSVDGQLDVESFISQMKAFMPDDSERIDWIQQYNNFEDVALPLHMIKKPYNATYTQFVELIIEEPKSCVREMLNNRQAKNDRFVLSFTSMLLLKAIGIGNEFLAEHNVHVTESAMMQIVEDTSEMIAHYANDNVSSMGLYDGKPYIINTDENTKDKWIKEAGALRDYVEGIPSIVCKKDWNKSEFDQLKMTELLGTPDYDAISIGINDDYTVIGTEAMITGFAMNEEIDVDVVSITNWLISTNIDVVNLIDLVKKLIAKGCIYSLTDQMVMYITDAVQKSHDEEEKREILTAWDSLFEVYDSADVTYKAYGIEALRCTYISVHEIVDEPSRNPIIQIFIQRLLWLLRLKVTARFNENGEIELVYYQVQEESES